MVRMGEGYENFGDVEPGCRLLGTAVLEGAEDKSGESRDYLAIVRADADAMIEHGRDV